MKCFNCLGDRYSFEWRSCSWIVPQISCWGKKTTTTEELSSCQAVAIFAGNDQRLGEEEKEDSVGGHNPPHHLPRLKETGDGRESLWNRFCNFYAIFSLNTTNIYILININVLLDQVSFEIIFKIILSIIFLEYRYWAKRENVVFLSILININVLLD